MKANDFIFMTKSHETNCGKQYPINAIGKVESDKPDRDNEIRVNFPTHGKCNYSYIPVSKVEVVPSERLDEAISKFNKSHLNYENALL